MAERRIGPFKYAQALEISTHPGQVWLEGVEAPWGQDQLLEGFTPDEAEAFAEALRSAAAEAREQVLRAER
jgi:hypothetical protein